MVSRTLVRGTVQDRIAVAPTINAENKSGLSPRSNPVCLEVTVTIRSLPGEAGGPSQPIREEARTVIVFDNGAVVRSTSNLPVGQKVILSNAAGRDVVCRVGTGHNLPSVKGYVEVEFLETITDFWSIHQDGGLGSAAAPPAISPASRQAQAPHPPPRVTPSLDSPVKPASVSLGSGPSFEDIPDLVTTSTTVVTRDSKPEPHTPAPEKATKSASDYSHSDNNDPTSLANWDAPQARLPADVRTIPMIGESAPRSSRGASPTHDFLSQGLMAYEKPSSSSGEQGRMPLLLGLAALVLAGVGAVVFVMHRNAASAPVRQKAAGNPPSAQVANPSPAPAVAEAPLDQAAQTAGEAAAHSQPAAQPLAIEENLPLAPVAATPAIVRGPASADANSEARTDSRNAKRQERTAVAAKPPEPAAPRRPAIPNLKMGAPSAPSQTMASSSDPSDNMTEMNGAMPSANLLTASGRTSAPPAAPSAFSSANPPAPASAPRTARDPQLISSTRPAYPLAAKESNVQGMVTVAASIDATGKVIATRALSGPMLLRQPAADSVKLWKYSPGLVDGKPAPTQVTVNVQFKLN